MWRMSNIPLPAPNRAEIHRIPPEILSEIFVHCLVPEDENSATQNTQQRLGSVCRLWRTIALATPGLWASLDITCNNDVLCPPLPVIGAYLQRSGTHPFSFVLHAMDARYSPSASILAALTTARSGGATPGYRVTPLPAEWETTLSAFLQRSSPALRRLSSAPHMAEPALMRILTLTPHLRILRLSNRLPNLPSITATFIRALHPPPPPSVPLCPRLQILELSGVSNCPDGLCAAMLRARWGAQAHDNGVVCLEQAHIGHEGGPHDCDEAEMKELCAEGMQGMIHSLL
ncbi:hypothetical protein BD779DRAFT_1798462 [Infundibulicybe gibba]|nr:hypothetical protein BD779DRAFT_1798462 [Infundibulicybe gibba]